MYDIAVIGAGPAGATAALFAAKAGKKTLLIDNDKTMTKRAWVENHYGVLEISGPELVETGKKQASKLGAEMVTATVDNITETETGFKIHLDNQTVESNQVILATGVLTDLAEKNWLGHKRRHRTAHKESDLRGQHGKTNKKKAFGRQELQQG